MCACMYFVRRQELHIHTTYMDACVHVFYFHNIVPVYEPLGSNVVPLFLNFIFCSVDGGLWIAGGLFVRRI